MTVLREKGTIGPATVYWSVAPISEGEELDVQPSEDMIVFSSDETSKTIELSISADDVPELQEVRHFCATKNNCNHFH